MRTIDRHLPHLLSLSLAAALLAGCGPASDLVEPIASEDLGTGAQALSSGNGLSANGLNRNGLNRNGLNRNGLNSIGLAKPEFNTWFNEDVASSDQVMKYFYGCAAASNKTLTWTNPTTGKAYSWKGALGLAPAWTGGTPATVAEQQVITACLAAHVNKYGLSVPIAIEGRSATGTQIAIAAGELTTYSVREACFFGNLFASQGVFLANDFTSWSAANSTARGCALGGAGECLPMVNLSKQCGEVCTPDTTGTFWESCTWNGTVFKPLTTRLKPADVYTCGDGVCQFTEQCGGAWTVANCSDCGLCEL